MDWDYNAWGNKYPPFDLDEVVPTRIAEILKVPVFYPRMILEGGSIEVNGAGALLTSESCLLNKNRNQNSRAEKSSNAFATISASAKFFGWAMELKATTPTATLMISHVSFRKPKLSPWSRRIPMTQITSLFKTI